MQAKKCIFILTLSTFLRENQYVKERFFEKKLIDKKTRIVRFYRTIRFSFMPYLLGYYVITILYVLLHVPCRELLLRC